MAMNRKERRAQARKAASAKARPGGQPAAPIAALRAHLANPRDRLPLFDGERFVHSLESVYSRIWARHEADLPPAPIDL